jgi:hypothetical protein
MRDAKKVGLNAPVKKSVLLGIVVVVVAVAAAAAFLLGTQQAAPVSEPAPEQKVIKVGVLCDLTGPTSEQGKPACLGFMDAVEWFEKNYPLPKGYNCCGSRSGLPPWDAAGSSSQ